MNVHVTPFVMSVVMIVVDVGVFLKWKHITSFFEVSKRDDSNCKLWEKSKCKDEGRMVSCLISHTFAHGGAKGIGGFQLEPCGRTFAIQCRKDNFRVAQKYGITLVYTVSSSRCNSKYCFTDR